MVFTLLFSAESRASSVVPLSVQKSLQFGVEGNEFPTYAIFRDALNTQFFGAKHRICILTRKFEDREIALALFAASRRSLGTYLRIEPHRTEAANADRLMRLADDMRRVGLPIFEESLKKLKLSEPTMIAIDQRAWSVSVELSEMQNSTVSVEAAPMTSSEVCLWAQNSLSAKAATQP